MVYIQHTKKIILISRIRVRVILYVDFAKSRYLCTKIQAKQKHIHADENEHDENDDGNLVNRGLNGEMELTARCRPSVEGIDVFLSKF